jgi:hypothetical protein
MSGPGRRPTHLCNHGIDLTVRGIKRATIKSSSDTRVRVITDPMARSCQAMARCCNVIEHLGVERYHAYVLLVLVSSLDTPHTFDGEVAGLYVPMRAICAEACR